MTPAGPPLACLGSCILTRWLCACPRYESVIATLCENLDSLDEPEARAAMIWIVGEYAERIDNADELLESFLEGFHDESTQVSLPVGSASRDAGWACSSASLRSALPYTLPSASSLRAPPLRMLC